MLAALDAAPRASPLAKALYFLSTKIEIGTSLRQARVWLQSVVQKYKFLMNALDDWFETQDVRTTEEHFLVISLKHSIEWLIQVERHCPEIRDESKNFRRSIDAKLVTHVRNKREHYIGSFKGDDNAEKTTRVLVDGYFPVELDATSTIIMEGHYLLGGVNITPIAENAVNLIDRIKEIETKNEI